MHWQPPENPLPPEADEPSNWDRWMRPLYWLAGARWETLQHCPATERERIAVLGSTVLIPTIMSFLGMIFTRRAASPIRRGSQSSASRSHGRS